MSEWLEHADWWLREVDDDPIYRMDVLPMAASLIGPCDGVVLDLGCGEGQVMRYLPGRVVGCDISPPLLLEAKGAGPVVRAKLPSLEWLRPGSVDVAYSILVLEHLADLELFASAARVVRPDGALAIVANHPAFTAAASGPVMDPSDGELLWRWGNYFESASVDMPAGGSKVTFYHRPLDAILNAAAAAGWRLVRVVELGLSDAAIAVHPGYAGQQHMPRLLGARWINTQGGRRSRR